MKTIFYVSGFKYQISKDFVIQTNIKPNRDIVTDYLELTIDGLLTIKRGYASDGPTDPAIDTKTFMRGAFIHDAFYELIRKGYLLEKLHRKPADKLLYKICREDKMNIIRASYVYFILRKRGKKAAMKSSIKNIQSAPF